MHFYIAYYHFKTKTKRKKKKKRRTFQQELKRDMPACKPLLDLQHAQLNYTYLSASLAQLLKRQIALVSSSLFTT